MLKNITPSLPEHGKIKSGTKGEEVISTGGKKFRLPQKLDHYIITTTERDHETDLLILEDELMDKLKKDKALIDTKKNLTSIPIRLLYNDIDLNFHTRNACYVGGKCVCSGDGETAKTRDGRDVECPCNKINYDYEGKDKCKVNGKLFVVVDGTETVGACHILRTTSKNTVRSILGGLTFIKASSGGLLAFLPLHLMLKPMTVDTGNGIRTIYVSSIVFRGSIENLQTKSLEMARSKAKYLIAMDSVEDKARQVLENSTESDQEQKDVQAEFYPDNDNLDVQNGEVVTETENNKTEPPKVEPEKSKESTKSKLDLAKESISKKAETPSVDKKQDVDQPDNTTETGNKDDDIPFEPEAVEGKSETITPGEVEAPARMITKDQKHQIVKLKKKFKVATGPAWEKLLKPFNVKTANDLTYDQAEKFIESLSTNPT